MSKQVESHSRKFTLNGHEPVPCVDVLEWARWYESCDRQVALWQRVWRRPVRVSTVFLGIDHNFGGEGLPILFETMVFGGPLDQEQVRYSTWNEAEAGHKAIVKRVKSQ